MLINLIQKRIMLSKLPRGLEKLIILLKLLIRCDIMVKMVKKLLLIKEKNENL